VQLVNTPLVVTDRIVGKANTLSNKEGLPRIADVFVSLVGLILTAPLIGFSAFAILVTSPGPVIFRQERVGLRGRTFILYKLRTMRTGIGGPQVTANQDPRVTFVGRLLRKTKIDELPELFNVIKGDMALVGPRPEVPRYVNTQDPLWKLVLESRPGITDPVTLQLRNEETLLAGVSGNPESFYLNTLQPFKLKGYLEYRSRRNWWSDVKVLTNTAFRVILPGSETQPTLREISGSAGAKASTSFDEVS
jgi:lipopolysaccharide/colanic/teichoic acid biosynthesis glycosyltransferase